MIYAVVSLLDREHRYVLQNLCDKLQQAFCACGIYVTTFPHFSYHVAQAYDVARLEPILAAISAKTPPFTVRANGIGLFTGATPILYTPIVRTPTLSRLHQRLWEEIGNTSVKAVLHFEAQNWIPHITLAYGDLNEHNLPKLIQWLSKQTLSWELSVDNLALIYNTGTEQGLQYRFPLKG